MEDIYMNDIELEKVREQKASTRNRTVLAKFLSASPKIQYISEPDENGDMVFVINTKDIGMNNEYFEKYCKEIFSNFVVDFMGELLIRDNLAMFVPYITSMKCKDYLKAVGYCRHIRFGMKREKEKMVFRFHISFLQEILTEDFKTA